MTMHAPTRAPRTVPRISANKLGEYLRAAPARRRSIVKDQKTPKEFVVAWYASARQTIVDAFAAGQIDGDALWDAAEELNTRATPADFDKRLADASAEALRQFVDVLDNLDLEGASFLSTEPMQPTLNFADVEVSVRPDLIVQAADRRGNPVVGAVKLHFSKSAVFDKEAGDYVATLLNQHVDKYIATRSTPVNRQHCWVIDVFGGNVFTPPSAQKKRLDDIEAACSEIKLWWAQV